jgi:molybdopterin-binding protein
MALSARNQLPGTIEDIQMGDIMAHVVVKVGDNLVESVITRNSAQELGLKKGDSVKVVVKSTEVMIQKGWAHVFAPNLRTLYPLSPGKRSVRSS